MNHVSHVSQTKLSTHHDTSEAGQPTTPEKSRSVESARSAKDHKKQLEDKDREYKILKAMEQARAKYNRDKVMLKESGDLIDPRDVWGNLMTSLQDEEWKMDRVIKTIEEQIPKGNVLTRQGEAPGRYYFIWHDPNGDVKGEGEGV